VYELSFTKVSDGTLRYRIEGSTEWKSTLVTTKDIERYYEFISQMAAKQELGPRPMNIGPDGKEKSWSRCDAKYCPVSGICDRFEDKGYAEWLKQVTKEFVK
jgi:hypothetical protein